MEKILLTKQFGILVETYVWPVTFWFVALSSLIFFGLIVARFFKDQALYKKQVRKQELQKQISVHLASPLKNLKETVLQDMDDMNLLAEIAPTLLRALKGNSYQRLLDAFEKIGLYGWAFRKLYSNNMQYKLSAIRLIAFWPDTRARQRLETLLEQSSPLVQRAVIETLAQSQDISLLIEVIYKFREEEGFSTLLMADVFQKFGPPAFGELEYYLFAQSTPARIKMAIILSLIHAADIALMHKIGNHFYNDEDDELRVLAYHAFYASGEVVDTKYIKLGTKDKDWRIRQYVAKLARYIDPLPVTALKTLLEDENWLVGLCSGQTLYDVGAVGVRLLQTLAEKDSVAGRRARMILAEKQGSNEVSYGLA